MNLSSVLFMERSISMFNLPKYPGQVQTETDLLTIIHIPEQIIILSQVTTGN